MLRIDKWITEGSAISNFDGYDKLIYQNGIVKTFLTDPKKHFIIAGKGIGKTILLKYKRYLMEKDADGILFLPSDRPYIDFVENLTTTFSTSKIKQFSDVEFCENFWRIAMQIYMLSSTSIPDLTSARLKRDIKSITSFSASIDKHFEFLLEERRGIETICNYLIFNVGEHDLPRLFSVSYLITELFREIIQGPVVYFFDRFDQTLKYTDAKVWLSMQQGLLEAVWNIMKNNSHVKIYLSLRQEAYDAYCGINKNAMTASISLISYSERELVDLVEQLVCFYEDGKSLETFLRIKNFKNIVAHVDEPVFQFMNRYSIGRPRDFVTFCGNLSDRVNDIFENDEKRTEELKNVIITSSSSSIISGLHEEVSMLLTCLQTREKFDDFISRFSRNVLTYKELQKCCAEYNGSSCSKKCSNCKANSEHFHPFCDLYIMGLLGKIKQTDGSESLRQVFKSPYEDITKVGIIHGDAGYYLIHPALRNYIKSLNSTYHLYDCLLIGDNQPWTEKDSIITDVNKEIDKIKKKNAKTFLSEQLGIFAQSDVPKPYSQLSAEYMGMEMDVTSREKQIIDKVLKSLSSDRELYI